MARKANNALVNYLSIMLSNFQLVSKNKPIKAETGGGLYEPRKSSVSQQERNDIIKPLLDIHSSGTQKTREPQKVLDYAKDVSEGIAQRRIDNERILQMAPEVAQAASIVIPSILSPNDLRKEDVQISAEHQSLNTGEKTKISNILTEYFNERLRMNTRFYEWIFEILYRSGSQPLLLIPLSELDNQFNNPDHFNEISTENLDLKLNALEDTSIFGVQSSATSNTVPLKDAHSSVISSLEEAYPNLYDSRSQKSETRRKYTPEKGSKLKPLIDDITSEESLQIIDNPDVVKRDVIKRKKMDHNIAKSMTRHYKEAGFIPLSDAHEEDSRHKGHPFFMEIVSDSVIPIFAPKSPSDHIGYFVLLDENGCPVKGTDEEGSSKKDKLRSYSKENKNDFHTLFKAYGVNDFIADDVSGERVIQDTYQKIIESHLQKNLAKGGFTNVGIGQDNSVYKAMFTRYLAKRKTKLLFVPKEMMIYPHYKCGSDGTGQSILEECKFILSLRITLTISRMMASVNNAVDRREIEVNFDQNFKGDVLEYLEKIKEAYFEKNTLNFSYNPQDISSQIAEKGLSIKANNIPGMNQFSINHTDQNRNAPTPDESLSDDIRNLLILSLRVPPSALNSLSEDEYSRSIATTNLFFSRYIKTLQNLVTRQFSEFIRTYIRYSKTLQKDIMDVIVASNDEKNTSKDKPTLPTDKEFGFVFDRDMTSKQKSSQAFLNKIIDSIEISLPPPNVAPDSAQFESLDKFVGSASTLIEQLYSDEIVATDGDLVEALSEYRALVKSNIMQTYLNTIGLGKNMHIPDINDVGVKADGQDFHQVLINFKESIQEMKRQLEPKDKA